MKDRFNTLLIDPNTSSRNRLKQALSSSRRFGEILTASSVEQTMQVLNREVFVDVVFICSSLGEETIARLVSDTQMMFTARDAAFIVISQGGENAFNIATGLMDGVSGFLLAPYSVEALIEVVEISVQVKQKQSEEKVSKALRFYIDGLRAQLNDIAQLRSTGGQAGISSQVFQEMCQELRSFTTEVRERYFELIVDELTKESSVRADLAKQAFSSGSYSTKRRFADKTISHLKRAVA